jgi:RNA polymerase sigma-B factor
MPAPPPATDVEQLHACFASTRDPAVRAELLAHYDRLALSLARQFPTRRESREDLAQVARIGLIHAVDRYDPARGRPFTAFARATIIGEIKRHLRDHTWSLHVPRTLQEHYYQVVGAVDELTQELGRLPTVPEVADRTGLTEEQVIEARGVDAADRVQSIDAPDGEGPHLEPSEDDPDLEAVAERADLAALVRALPEPAQRVLRLRFVDQLTQTEIGRRVGVNQMGISRSLTRTLGRMRVLAGEENSGASTVRQCRRGPRARAC